MGLNEKYIGIEQIVDYLYSIGISDENDQDRWIHQHLNYKTYSLSDESALFVYDYFEENLEGCDIEKNVSVAGLDCLMWAVERNRPVSSGYQIPY